MNIVQLRKEVAALIADVEKTHRYSMSRIYALSNEIFARDEKPQSCSSCLIRKVRELRNWLDSQEVVAELPDSDSLSAEDDVTFKASEGTIKPVLKRGRKRKTE